MQENHHKLWWAFLMWQMWNIILHFLSTSKSIEGKSHIGRLLITPSILLWETDGLAWRWSLLQLGHSSDQRSQICVALGLKADVLELWTTCYACAFLNPGEPLEIDFVRGALVLPIQQYSGLRSGGGSTVTATAISSRDEDGILLLPQALGRRGMDFWPSPGPSHACATLISVTHPVHPRCPAHLAVWGLHALLHPALSIWINLAALSCRKRGCFLF